MTLWLLLSITFLFAGCGVIESPTDPDGSGCSRPAPLFEYENPIPDSYIVIFNDGVDVRAEAERLAAKHGFKLTSVWERALRGFGAVIQEPALMGLRCEHTIKEIHQNIPSVPTGR